MWLGISTVHILDVRAGSEDPGSLQRAAKNILERILDYTELRTATWRSQERNLYPSNREKSQQYHSR